MAKKKIENVDKVEEIENAVTGDIDGYEVSVYHVGDDEVEFTYTKKMPIGSKLLFVESVVNTVVGDDYYYPMLKDLMFDFQLVNVLTDVDIEIDGSNGTVDMVNQIEEFFDNTDIADVLKINLDIDMLMELYDGVDRAIEYKTGIHPSPIADGIASILKVAEEKMRGFDVGSINELASVFTKMQGDITPEKMLDAYAKSDVFKKMAKEAVEKQEKRDTKMDVVIGGLADA